MIWISVGGVLISLSQAVEPVGEKKQYCLWRMANATPDLQLHSQPKLVLISPTHRGMARLSWPSEWLNKFGSTYGTLRLQGWRVHCTHAAAEASYDRERSSSYRFHCLIRRRKMIPENTNCTNVYWYVCQKYVSVVFSANIWTVCHPLSISIAT